MALRHTFAGLMQGAEPFWEDLTISRRGYSLKLTPSQRDRLRIVGLAGGAPSQVDVSGQFATAFQDADGRVIKITTDPADSFAHWVAQGHPRVVPIYGMYIMNYGGRKFYAIITDFIGGLPPIPERYEMFYAKDLTTLDYRWILPSAAGAFELNWDDKRVGKADFSFGAEDYEQLKRSCAGDEMVFIPERVQLTPAQKRQVAALKRKSSAYCKKAGLEIAALAEYLARRGVALRDLHRENFGMKKNGEWVVRDMGASKKYEDTPVPELKGLYLANFKGLR